MLIGVPVAEAMSATEANLKKRQFEMLSTAAKDRLGDDLSISEGEVSRTIKNALLSTSYFQVSKQELVFFVPSGLAFHYKRGVGTTFERPKDVSDDEVGLYFDGSVYGAIAWINGLVPLHASAIVHEGGIYAFTGLSGEGKSTLATALGRRGMTVCSDDVLLLDPSYDSGIKAIAGHQRSKLWADALALTGQSSTHAVTPNIQKYYVEHDAFWDGAPLPMRQLYLLESVLSGSPSVVPISGVKRFDALRSAFYRPQFGEAIGDIPSYVRTVTHIMQHIGIARFVRTREPDSFYSSVDMIEAHIRSVALSAPT